MHLRATVRTHWALAALTLATLVPVASGAGSLLTPEARREGAEALVWNAKLTCGTTEAGITRYGMWEGRMYSRSPGEKDRHVLTSSASTRASARA